MQFPFQAVVFDFGNVLMDLDIPRSNQALSKLIGNRWTEAEIFFRKNHTMEEFECGFTDSLEFLSDLSLFVTDRVQAEHLIKAWNSMLLGIPPARLDWLFEITEELPCFVFSNTNSIHLQWVDNHLQEEHDTDLETFNDLFRNTFYSYLMGCRKPELEAFEKMLAGTKLPRESILYIDDLPENIAVAKSLGIPSYLHNPAEEISEIFSSIPDRIS